MERKTRPVPKNRLRVLREGCGWTIYDVADRIGISASGVSRHETGNLQLAGMVIDRYCRLYGVGPLDLYVEWCPESSDSIAS